jgi:two-component system, cell cycle sensor histidine kinase and response regulator CckA
MGRDLKEVESALAHDLNNYLQVVMGNLELLRRKNAFVPEIVTAALNATRHAAQLADRLTALGRLHPYEARAVDLVRLLTDLRAIVERVVGDGFRVTAEVAPDLATALIDPRLLHVVLLELASHARDVTPGGGQICLRAANAADGRISVELAIAAPDGLVHDIVEACIGRIGGSMELSSNLVRLYLPAAR